MKKYRPLSTKITIFATAVIITASVLIAISVYLISHRFFVDATRDSLVSRTDLIANELEGWITKPTKDLATLIKTPPIKGIIRSMKNNGIDKLDNSTLPLWKKRLATIFDSVLKSNDNYTQIRYIGIADNGREIVRVNQHENVTYKTTESALQNKGNRSYYKSAIQLTQGSIGYSDISYNIERGKISLPLTLTQRIYSPVYTADQKIFGLVIINININQYLQRVLNNLDIKYNIYLYDDEKNLFIYDKKHRVLHYYPNIEVLKKKKIPIPKDIKKVNTRQKIKEILNNKNDIIVTKEIYTTKQRDRRIFTLVNAIPKKEVLTGDFKLTNYILLITLIISFIACLLIYIFTNNLMARLSKLTKIIKNIKAGNMDDINIPIFSNDEVGLLARAFENQTKQLNALALYDSLTGLPNRANFYSHLHEAVNRSKRSKKIIAVFYIDINGFKDINDRFGHDYGDNLLVQLGKKLKQLSRKTDFYARLSGDEFVVYYEDIASKEHVKTISHELERNLSDTYLVKGAQLSVTVSGGASIYPVFADNIEMLLKQADQMMYKSKKEGKGRFFIYGDNNELSSQ